MLCDVPRTATVVAHGDLETLRVSKDRFFHPVTQFPQVGIEVMRALASKLHSTTQALTTARAKLDELDRRGGSG
jgi:CRP/FNR family transcriptional regulator, cyclic AMP receptor protein